MAKNQEGRGPGTDPTANVMSLVEAAMKRQDDLRDALDRRIEARIAGFERLSDSRHIATSGELRNIEERRVEHKKDTKDNVDSAFKAASEAVREQAASSEKAISKSEGTVSGQIKAVEGTVDDLKDRVRTLETQQSTKSEVREDNRSSVGMIVGVVGALLTIIATIIAVNALFAGAA